MFVAHYSNTMATARVLPNAEPPRIRPLSSREKLIALSRAWQERQAEAELKALRAEERKLEVLRARRKAVEAIQNDYRPPSAEEIISIVAFWHGLTTEDIRRKSRERPLVEARFDAIAEVRRHYPPTGASKGRTYSLKWLARHFRRDHSTIVHALEQRGLHVSMQEAG